MPKGQRLDLYLVEKGLFPSRESAQTAIMDGGIIVNGEKITKAGTTIKENAKVEITSQWQPRKYVSRGGLKLEKALDGFAVDPKDRICLDLGASTGGFTDCLLSRGALRVYAVDVGYGQIAWSLRTDPRVVVLERINARHLDASQLYGSDERICDLVVIDVSFISLSKILPSCLNVVSKENLDIIALIKPQFEAGKDSVGKGGVVRSPEKHKEILKRIIADAHLNLTAKQLTYSPIKGPSGNIEFLVHWVHGNEKINIDIDLVVDEAHRSLA